jgi:hypothetical protein
LNHRSAARGSAACQPATIFDRAENSESLVQGGGGRISKRGEVVDVKQDLPAFQHRLSRRFGGQVLVANQHTKWSVFRKRERRGGCAGDEVSDVVAQQAAQTGKPLLPHGILTPGHEHPFVVAAFNRLIAADQIGRVTTLARAGCLYGMACATT